MNFKTFLNKQKIGVFPGAFCPPHQGHFNVALEASKTNEIVHIIISPKGRDEITARQSFLIWKEYSKLIPNLKIQIAKITPVRTAYELIDLINKTPNASKTVINLYSDKDDKDRWDNIKQFGAKLQKINKIETPRIFAGKLMRLFLRRGNKRDFFKNLPKGCDKEKIWKILLP